MRFYSKLSDTYKFILCLSVRKILNLFFLRLSYFSSSYLHFFYQKGFPFSVSVEPTTICNLNCSECPSGQKSFSRPTGKINVVFYTQIIDSIKKSLGYLILYFQGEPFLHPDFFELVKIARERNIYVATSTNAHFLTIENANKTILSGLNRLIISLDGIDKDTYLKYRKGGNFEKVIEGIKNLTNAKKELKVHHPYVILQFIVFSNNEHQVEDVKKLGKSIGVDEVQIKTAQIYNYKNGNQLIPENEKYSRYKRISTTEYQLKKKGKNKCLRMWQSAVITWDGKVVPCCFDKDADFILGDLKSNDFSKIWKSENYNLFRKKILKNRNGINICCNCSE